MRAIFPLTVLLGAGAATAQTAPRVIANVGLVGSECVRYDTSADRYIVSDLNGAEPGFVSIVSPDGAVEQLKWIDGGVSGLADPLGLFVAGDKVYVATSRRSGFTTGAAVRPFPPFPFRARSD
ncbi:hypothetical protein [Sphingomonas crusticola]|uniref:hypothetical protein n=1 Tax=Sphingomonas crusticola TaxID=1697973 RepID=UPI001F07E21A|nr:hypothetical protein [Sphingomonas crusticola]